MTRCIPSVLSNLMNHQEFLHNRRAFTAVEHHQVKPRVHIPIGSIFPIPAHIDLPCRRLLMVKFLHQFPSHIVDLNFHILALLQAKTNARQIPSREIQPVAIDTEILLQLDRTRFV